MKAMEYYATGRRKRSIAKVWLKKGSGKIYVNGQSFETYFKRDTHKMQILRPFEIINQPTDYDVRCNVVGGGHTGQAGAMVHGISRALLLFDADFKPTLRKEKLTLCFLLKEKKKLSFSFSSFFLGKPTELTIYDTLGKTVYEKYVESSTRDFTLDSHC